MLVLKTVQCCLVNYGVVKRWKKKKLKKKFAAEDDDRILFLVFFVYFIYFVFNKSIFRAILWTNLFIFTLKIIMIFINHLQIHIHEMISCQFYTRSSMWNISCMTIFLSEIVFSFYCCCHLFSLHFKYFFFIGFFFLSFTKIDST